jgi:hypothetical protein
MAKTINLTITGRKRLCLGGWGGGFVDTFAREHFDKDTCSCVFLEVVNKKLPFFLQTGFLSHSMV